MFNDFFKLVSVQIAMAFVIVAEVFKVISVQASIERLIEIVSLRSLTL